MPLGILARGGIFGVFRLLAPRTGIRWSWITLGMTCLGLDPLAILRAQSGSECTYRSQGKGTGTNSLGLFTGQCRRPERLDEISSQSQGGAEAQR